MNRCAIRSITIIVLLATSMLTGMDSISETRLKGIQTKPEQLLQLALTMLKSEKVREGTILLSQIAKHSNKSFIKLQAQIALIENAILHQHALGQPMYHASILALWDEAKKLSLNEDDQHFLEIQYAHYLYHHAPQEQREVVKNAYIGIARYEGKNALPNIVNTLVQNDDATQKQVQYIAEIFNAHCPFPVVRATMQAILAKIIHKTEPHRSEELWQEVMDIANHPLCPHRWMLYAMYAHFLYAQGECAEANKYYTALIQQTDDLERRAETCVILGNNALSDKNYSGALSYFNSALASNPKRPKNRIQAYQGKAIALSEKLTFALIKESLELTYQADQLQKMHHLNLTDIDEYLALVFDLKPEELQETMPLATIERATLYYANILIKHTDPTVREHGSGLLNELATASTKSIKHEALFAQAHYYIGCNSSDSLDQALAILQNLAKQKTSHELRIKIRYNLGTILLDKHNSQEALSHLEYVLRQEKDIVLRLCAVIGLIDYYTANPTIPINPLHVRDILTIKSMYESAQGSQFTQNSAPDQARQTMAFLYGKTLLSLANLWQQRPHEVADLDEDPVGKCYTTAMAIEECPTIRSLATLHYEAYKKQRETKSPKKSPKKHKKKKKTTTSIPGPAQQPTEPAPLKEDSAAPFDEIVPEPANGPLLAELASAETAAETPEDENNDAEWESALLHNRLLSAVKRNDTQTIKELVAQGANPHYQIQGKPISFWTNDASCLRALLENSPATTPVMPQPRTSTLRLPELRYSKEAAAALASITKKDSVIRALEDLQYGRGNVKALHDSTQSFTHRLRLGKLRIGFIPQDNALEIVTIEYRKSAYK